MKKNSSDNDDSGGGTGCRRGDGGCGSLCFTRHWHALLVPPFLILFVLFSAIHAIQDSGVVESSADHQQQQYERGNGGAFSTTTGVGQDGRYYRKSSHLSISVRGEDWVEVPSSTATFSRVELINTHPTQSIQLLSMYVRDGNDDEGFSYVGENEGRDVRRVESSCSYSSSSCSPLVIPSKSFFVMNFTPSATLAPLEQMEVNVAFVPRHDATAVYSVDNRVINGMRIREAKWMNSGGSDDGGDGVQKHEAVLAVVSCALSGTSTMSPSSSAREEQGRNVTQYKPLTGSSVNNRYGIPSQIILQLPSCSSSSSLSSSCSSSLSSDEEDDNNDHGSVELRVSNPSEELMRVYDVSLHPPPPSYDVMFGGDDADGGCRSECFDVGDGSCGKKKKENSIKSGMKLSSSSSSCNFVGSARLRSNVDVTVQFGKSSFSVEDPLVVTLSSSPFYVAALEWTVRESDFVRRALLLRHETQQGECDVEQKSRGQEVESHKKGAGGRVPAAVLGAVSGFCWGYAHVQTDHGHFLIAIDVEVVVDDDFTSDVVGDDGDMNDVYENDSNDDLVVDSNDVDADNEWEEDEDYDDADGDLEAEDEEEEWYEGDVGDGNGYGNVGFEGGEDEEDDKEGLEDEFLLEENSKDGGPGNDVWEVDGLLVDDSYVGDGDVVDTMRMRGSIITSAEDSVMAEEEMVYDIGGDEDFDEEDDCDGDGDGGGSTRTISESRLSNVQKSCSLSSESGSSLGAGSCGSSAASCGCGSNEGGCGTSATSCGCGSNVCGTSAASCGSSRSVAEEILTSPGGGGLVPLLTELNCTGAVGVGGGVGAGATMFVTRISDHINFGTLYASMEDEDGDYEGKGGGSAAAAAAFADASTGTVVSDVQGFNGGGGRCVGAGVGGSGGGVLYVGIQNRDAIAVKILRVDEVEYSITLLDDPSTSVRGARAGEGVGRSVPPAGRSNPYLRIEYVPEYDGGRTVIVSPHETLARVWSVSHESGRVRQSCILRGKIRITTNHMDSSSASVDVSYEVRILRGKLDFWAGEENEMGGGGKMWWNVGVEMTKWAHAAMRKADDAFATGLYRGGAGGSDPSEFDKIIPASPKRFERTLRFVNYYPVPVHIRNMHLVGCTPVARLVYSLQAFRVGEKGLKFETNGVGGGGASATVSGSGSGLATVASSDGFWGTIPGLGGSWSMRASLEVGLPSLTRDLIRGGSVSGGAKASTKGRSVGVGGGAGAGAGGGGGAGAGANSTEFFNENDERRPFLCHLSVSTNISDFSIPIILYDESLHFSRRASWNAENSNTRHEGKGKRRTVDDVDVHADGGLEWTSHGENGYEDEVDAASTRGLRLVRLLHQPSSRNHAGSGVDGDDDNDNNHAGGKLRRKEKRDKMKRRTRSKSSLRSGAGSKSHSDPDTSSSCSWKRRQTITSVQGGQFERFIPSSSCGSSDDSGTSSSSTVLDIPIGSVEAGGMKTVIFYITNFNPVSVVLTNPLEKNYYGMNLRLSRTSADWTDFLPHDDEKQPSSNAGGGVAGGGAGKSNIITGAASSYFTITSSTSNSASSPSSSTSTWQSSPNYAWRQRTSHFLRSSSKDTFLGKLKYQDDVSFSDMIIGTSKRNLWDELYAKAKVVTLYRSKCGRSTGQGNNSASDNESKNTRKRWMGCGDACGKFERLEHFLNRHNATRGSDLTGLGGGVLLSVDGTAGYALRTIATTNTVPQSPIPTSPTLTSRMGATATIASSTKQTQNTWTIPPGGVTGIGLQIRAPHASLLQQQSHPDVTSFVGLGLELLNVNTLERTKLVVRYDAITGGVAVHTRLPPTGNAPFSRRHNKKGAPNGEAPGRDRDDDDDLRSWFWDWKTMMAPSTKTAFGTDSHRDDDDGRPYMDYAYIRQYLHEQGADYGFDGHRHDHKDDVGHGIGTIHVPCVLFPQPTGEGGNHDGVGVDLYLQSNFASTVKFLDLRTVCNSRTFQFILGGGGNNRRQHIQNSTNAASGIHVPSMASDVYIGTVHSVLNCSPEKYGYNFYACARRWLLDRQRRASSDCGLSHRHRRRGMKKSKRNRNSRGRGNEDCKDDNNHSDFLHKVYDQQQGGADCNRQDPEDDDVIDVLWGAERDLLQRAINSLSDITSYMSKRYHTTNSIPDAADPSANRNAGMQYSAASGNAAFVGGKGDDGASGGSGEVPNRTNPPTASSTGTVSTSSGSSTGSGSGSGSGSLFSSVAAASPITAGSSGAESGSGPTSMGDLHVMLGTTGLNGEAGATTTATFQGQFAGAAAIRLEHDPSHPGGPVASAAEAASSLASALANSGVLQGFVTATANVAGGQAGPGSGAFGENIQNIIGSAAGGGVASALSKIGASVAASVAGAGRTSHSFSSSSTSSSLPVAHAEPIPRSFLHQLAIFTELWNFGVTFYGWDMLETGAEAKLRVMGPDLEVEEEQNDDYEECGNDHEGEKQEAKEEEDEEDQELLDDDMNVGDVEHEDNSHYEDGTGDGSSSYSPFSGDADALLRSKWKEINVPISRYRSIDSQNDKVVAENKKSIHDELKCNGKERKCDGNVRFSESTSCSHSEERLKISTRLHVPRIAALDGSTLEFGSKQIAGGGSSFIGDSRRGPETASGPGPVPVAHVVKGYVRVHNPTKVPLFARLLLEETDPNSPATGQDKSAGGSSNSNNPNPNMQHDACSVLPPYVESSDNDNNNDGEMKNMGPLTARYSSPLYIQDNPHGSKTHPWWTGGSYYMYTSMDDVLLQSNHNITIKSGGGTHVSLINPSMQAVNSFCLGCGRRCNLRNEVLNSEKLFSPIGAASAEVPLFRVGAGAASASSSTASSSSSSSSPPDSGDGNNALGYNNFLIPSSLSPTKLPPAFALPYNSMVERSVPPGAYAMLGPIYFRPPARGVYTSEVIVENSLNGAERVKLRGKGGIERLIFESPRPLPSTKPSSSSPSRKLSSTLIGSNIEMRLGRPTLVFTGSAGINGTPSQRVVYVVNVGDLPVYVARVYMSSAELFHFTNLRPHPKDVNWLQSKKAGCQSRGFRLKNCVGDRHGRYWNRTSGVSVRGASADGKNGTNTHSQRSEGNPNGFILQPGQNASFTIEHDADCAFKTTYVTLNLELQRLSGINHLSNNGPAHASPHSRSHSARSNMGRLHKTAESFMTKKVELLIGYDMALSQYTKCQPTTSAASVAHSSYAPLSVKYLLNKNSLPPWGWGEVDYSVVERQIQNGGRVHWKHWFRLRLWQLWQCLTIISAPFFLILVKHKQHFASDVHIGGYVDNVDPFGPNRNGDGGGGGLRPPLSSTSSWFSKFLRWYWSWSKEEEEEWYSIVLYSCIFSFAVTTFVTIIRLTYGILYWMLYRHEQSQLFKSSLHVMEVKKLHITEGGISSNKDAEVPATTAAAKAKGGDGLAMRQQEQQQRQKKENIPSIKRQPSSYWLASFRCLTASPAAVTSTAGLGGPGGGVGAGIGSNANTAAAGQTASSLIEIGKDKIKSLIVGRYKKAAMLSPHCLASNGCFLPRLYDAPNPTGGGGDVVMSAKFHGGDACGRSNATGKDGVAPGTAETLKATVDDSGLGDSSVAPVDSNGAVGAASDQELVSVAASTTNTGGVVRRGSSSASLGGNQRSIHPMTTLGEAIFCGYRGGGGGGDYCAAAVAEPAARGDSRCWEQNDNFLPVPIGLGWRAAASKRLIPTLRWDWQWEACVCEGMSEQSKVRQLLVARASVSGSDAGGGAAIGTGYTGVDQERTRKSAAAPGQESDAGRSKEYDQEDSASVGALNDLVDGMENRTFRATQVKDPETEHEDDDEDDDVNVNVLMPPGSVHLNGSMDRGGGGGSTSTSAGPALVRGGFTRRDASTGCQEGFRYAKQSGVVAVGKAHGGGNGVSSSRSKKQFLDSRGIASATAASGTKRNIPQPPPGLEHVHYRPSDQTRRSGGMPLTPTSTTATLRNVSARLTAASLSRSASHGSASASKHLGAKSLNQQSCGSGLIGGVPVTWADPGARTRGKKGPSGGETSSRTVPSPITSSNTIGAGVSGSVTMKPSVPPVVLDLGKEKSPSLKSKHIPSTRGCSPSMNPLPSPSPSPSAELTGKGTGTCTGTGTGAGTNSKTRTSAGTNRVSSSGVITAAQMYYSKTKKSSGGAKAASMWSSSLSSSAGATKAPKTSSPKVVPVDNDERGYKQSLPTSVGASVTTSSPMQGNRALAGLFSSPSKVGSDAYSLSHPPPLFLEPSVMEPSETLIKKKRTAAEVEATTMKTLMTPTTESEAATTLPSASSESPLFVPNKSASSPRAAPQSRRDDLASSSTLQAKAAVFHPQRSKTTIAKAVPALANTNTLSVKRPPPGLLPPPGFVDESPLLARTVLTHVPGAEAASTTGEAVTTAMGSPMLKDNTPSGSPLAPPGTASVGSGCGIGTTDTASPTTPAVTPFVSPRHVTTSISSASASANAAVAATLFERSSSAGAIPTTSVMDQHGNAMGSRGYLVGTATRHDGQKTTSPTSTGTGGKGGSPQERTGQSASSCFVGKHNADRAMGFIGDTGGGAVVGGGRGESLSTLSSSMTSSLDFMGSSNLSLWGSSGNFSSTRGSGFSSNAEGLGGRNFLGNEPPPGLGGETALFSSLAGGFNVENFLDGILDESVHEDGSSTDHDNDVGMVVVEARGDDIIDISGEEENSEITSAGAGSTELWDPSAGEVLVVGHGSELIGSGGVGEGGKQMTSAVGGALLGHVVAPGLHGSSPSVANNSDENGRRITGGDIRDLRLPLLTPAAILGETDEHAGDVEAIAFGSGLLHHLHEEDNEGIIITGSGHNEEGDDDTVHLYHQRNSFFANLMGKQDNDET